MAEKKVSKKTKTAGTEEVAAKTVTAGAEEEVKVVPNYDLNATVDKFVNYILKEGKKSVAQRIFNSTMTELRDKYGKKNPEQVFEKAIANVTPTIEVRPKRIGGGVYQVPIDVKPKRQVALAFRWILGAARDRKGQPMYKKLAAELIEAAENSGNAIKKRMDVQRMAEANKAFAHLAKY